MGIAMTSQLDEDRIAAEVDRLVDEQRITSLWFLRPDYYPSTRKERLRVLGQIERHGDMLPSASGDAETMALTTLQRRVCRLLAANRIASVGVALNELISAARISRRRPLHPAALRMALENGHIRFHRGSIRGALPTLVG